MDKRIIELCLDVINNISMYIIKRPEGKFTTKDQKEKILENMKS